MEKVVIRRFNGDDEYSWAVFREKDVKRIKGVIMHGDATPIVAGCSKREAQSYKQHCEKMTNNLKNQWRVLIKWDLISPTLGIASGNLILQKNLNNEVKYNKYTIAVKVERGKLSYSTFESGEKFPKEWDKIKDRVDIMVKSYHKGMILSKSLYCWVEDIELSNKSEGNNLVQDEITWAKI